MSRVSQEEAWRRVRSVLEMSDLVLEVIDARDPVETRNRRLEDLVNRLGKSLMMVINKADLVPMEVLKEWRRFLERDYPTVFISARDRLGTRKLIVNIKRYAQASSEGFRGWLPKRG